MHFALQWISVRKAQYPYSKSDKSKNRNTSSPFFYLSINRIHSTIFRWPSKSSLAQDPCSGCFISACVWRIRKAREGTEGAPDTADSQPSSPSRGARERRRFRLQGRFQPSCYWQEASLSIFTIRYLLKCTIHTSLGVLMLSVNKGKRRCTRLETLLHLHPHES